MPGISDGMDCWEDWQHGQHWLRSKLCGGKLDTLFGFENERRQLLDMVRRSAEFGESNSLLIIGPRGSGKTTLLQSVYDELCQNVNIKENLLRVVLNGLMQTDDRIALKEITRQLQLENTVGNKVFGSFAENLQFLLDSLKCGGQQSKSTLFVLEEFDLFAQHKNQTLLYNLFDVAQSAQAPICVVGLTTRLDVMELLEKRVKSRFSHRQLHLLPSLSFQQYLHMFTSYLSLPEGSTNSKVGRKYAKEWNKQLESLVEETAVLEVLKRQYNIDRDVRALQRLMVLPVCRISAEQPYLQAADFVDAGKLLSSDSKAAMLHGISVLELCLVIAMKHLTEVYQGEPFNFEMVFNEYHKFGRRSSMQLFQKPVVLKAFEHLCALELVRPTEGGGSKTQKEYRPMTLLMDQSQIMEALQSYPACPTEVKQWASSSLPSH